MGPPRHSNRNSARTSQRVRLSKPTADPDYHYFDVVGLWRKEPLTKSQLRTLRSCLTTRPRISNEPCLFDPSFKQFVRLFQPSEAALRFVASLDGVSLNYLNYLEIARDFPVKDEDAAARFVDLFNKHFVEPRHGKRASARFANGGTTRKAPAKGKSRRGRWFQWYGDHPAKKTGEAHCFHLEGRYQGSRALAQIGIHCVADLLCFDHLAYWKRHLNLYEINLERLGRFHENKRLRQRRRFTEIRTYGNGKIVFNEDLRRGYHWYRYFGWDREEKYESVQRFVDHYPFGRGPYLRRLPVPL